MAKGSERMLVIWRAKGGNPPIPGRPASFEPGSERGRSSPGDSRGELARGQRGSGKRRLVGPVSAAAGALQNAHGAQGGARCPCSGRRRPRCLLCARAPRAAARLAAQGGNAGGYSGPG